MIGPIPLEPSLREGEQDLYSRALEFAVQAHRTQTRKYTGEPYWHHVARVAAEVSRTEYRTIEMIEAALLHDVIEDCSVSDQLLRETFNPIVAHYVLLLTDPGPQAGNRAQRKEYVRRRLEAGPPEVKTIKLADLLDNGESIFEHDPHFGHVFYREKKELLPALMGGDMLLWERAYQLLKDYEGGRWTRAPRRP